MGKCARTGRFGLRPPLTLTATRCSGRSRIRQVKLRDLEPDHLRALYREVMANRGKGARGLSVSPVQGVHRWLHDAFEDAVLEGLLVRNAADPRVSHVASGLVRGDDPEVGVGLANQAGEGDNECPGPSTVELHHIAVARHSLRATTAGYADRRTGADRHGEGRAG